MSVQQPHHKEDSIMPDIPSRLRGRSVILPEEIYQCSGIKILGTRIKSLVFTTDVAVIKNCNAQAVMCVYPFTPTLTITQAVLDVANVPVFVGVGGGLTTGQRMVALSLHAELLGAYGVVVNAPVDIEMIREISHILDIPLVATVVSAADHYAAKVEAGATILNISGGKDTPALVRKIRADVGPGFPLIATGGNTPASILETIAAGANAITYTPPSSAEIFRTVMEKYRADGHA